MKLVSKKLIVAGMLMTASIASYADISINWFGSLGFYNNVGGGSPTDPDDYILFGGGVATAQLIWSPDSTVDILDPANSGGGYVSGDDVLLDTFSVSSAPYGDYSNGSEIYADSTFSQTLGGGGAVVYLRIFDTASPVFGEFYFDSSTLSTLVYDPDSPVTQFLNHNTGAAAGDELDQQIVPEPSVFAFLGLGSLIMFARRMRKA